MGKYTQDEINNFLWDAADSQRNTVDSNAFKDYILAFLFYKYISDLQKKERTKLEQQYGNDKDRIELKMKNTRFNLPKGTSFYDIYEQETKDNIGEIINEALKKIEESNGKKLENLFLVDFNSDILGPTQQKNKMLRDIIESFAKLDLTDVDDDILGNSYMYLIEKFGGDAGKKAGEFFTPKQVAKLLAKLAQPKPGDRIADPSMGSGGLLLLAGEEVEKQNSKNYALYGQEKTGSTYNLARMNMFLHKKDSARLEWGDTLNNPLLLENEQLMKFDVVVANPPFSLKKWKDSSLDSDKYNRFYRGMPPESKGDYAFIMHMVETAKPKKGRVAVIVPHGVLFRGSSEGIIRQKLIEENIIDAVIGLPANLFTTTTIPVAILIIDRSREEGGKNEKIKDVLFIDASKDFESIKAQNILTDEHINKIIETYKNRKDVKKYAHLASFKEIKENNFNLNITRYVDTFEEEKEVDIKAVKKEITDIEQQLKEVDEQMKKYLKELGL